MKLDIEGPKDETQWITRIDGTERVAQGYAVEHASPYYAIGQTTSATSCASFTKHCSPNRAPLVASLIINGLTHQLHQPNSSPSPASRTVVATSEHSTSPGQFA